VNFHHNFFDFCFFGIYLEGILDHFKSIVMRRISEASQNEEEEEDQERKEEASMKLNLFARRVVPSFVSIGKRRDPQFSNND